MFLHNRLSKKGSETQTEQAQLCTFEQSSNCDSSRIFWSFLHCKKGTATAWDYILALALGLIALIFLIWLATESANVGPSLLP